MILNPKTLEKLRVLINEQTEYRSGPQLVKFFNALGGNDQYGQGFPSRWVYTDEKLASLNGTPELDKLIKTLFNPIGYIGRYEQLDGFIAELNQFLAYDKWKITRNNTEIIFQRVDNVVIPNTSKTETLSESKFLNKEIEEVSLANLDLDSGLTSVIESRIYEIKKCLNGDASLAVIFLAGSSLEGILLGVASANPKKFNQARTAPKNDEKVKPFYEWSLNNLIDTSHELGILKEDVKRFSHALRDFRNYIHPLQQIGSNFHPDKHTAQICWQVLRAAIYQLSVNKIQP